MKPKIKHQKIINMKKTIVLISIALFAIATSFAQNNQQWRGIDRKGIYNEKNLLKSWSKDGPQLLWANEDVGNGFGSPVIAGDRIYIAGSTDSIANIYALDLNGKLIWKKDFGKEWIKTFPGSRSTPTIVDNLLYITSGIGNLFCLDAKTGDKKWSVDMLKDMHGRFTMHGHSESPLVFNDKVYLVPGGKDTNVVAFNRFTGKLIWICKGKGEKPGYNSPALIQIGKRNIIATFSGYALMGIDADSGELLWSHEQDNVPLDQRTPGNGDTHSNTIWYENGFIYYIAGDGNCAVKLELQNDGKSVKEIWRNKVVDNFMGGFIKTGNYIYSCTNAQRNLVAIDANTGLIADSLKCGIGNIISADGMLYYYNQKAEVNLIKVTGSKMEIVSSFKVTKGTKEHFAHPVICNGVLYIRHGKALMAYNVKKN